MSRDGSIGVGPQSEEGALLEVAQQPSTRQIIKQKLSQFCRQLNWSIGHVFLLDDTNKELVPTDIWYLDDDEAYDEFRRETAQHTFRVRQDVIGNILFSPEPVWVSDVSSYPGYVREKAARRVGIKSGLILPLFEGELIGVMEFYSTIRVQPDPQIVADILISSRKLGDHIEEQAEDLEEQEV